jgi:hypothetical protein
VLNEGGDNWSPWNVVMTGVHGMLVNENNDMIVVQECKK